RHRRGRAPLDRARGRLLRRDRSPAQRPADGDGEGRRRLPALCPPTRRLSGRGHRPPRRAGGRRCGSGCATRRVDGYEPWIVTTTFPRACPSPRYPSASGTSLSLYCLSMTGVTVPFSRSPCRTTRSALFIFARNGATTRRLLPTAPRRSLSA